MKILFVSALVVQALLILIDEFHYHWQRNLPKWERWGHPLDTCLFLIPLGFLAFMEPTPTAQWTYVALAVISTLTITKDEWVHRELITGGEQWLHSLLFILHPVILMAGFLLWQEPMEILLLVWIGILMFFLYQLIFWNFYADIFFKARR